LHIGFAVDPLDVVLEGPPVEGPPVEGPPVEESVLEGPLAEDLVAEDPLAEDLVTEDPVVEDVVAEDPPLCTLFDESGVLPEEPLCVPLDAPSVSALGPSVSSEFVAPFSRELITWLPSLIVDLNKSAIFLCQRIQKIMRPNKSHHILLFNFK